MSFALPRLPDVAEPKTLLELAKRLYVFASDVIEWMRLEPSLEYKAITTVAQFPIYVKTRAPVIYEVRRVQTYKTADSSQLVSDTSIAWRVSDNPALPGVIVTAMGGLTAGTDYTVLLAIQGSRANQGGSR